VSDELILIKHGAVAVTLQDTIGRPQDTKMAIAGRFSRLGIKTLLKFIEL